MKTLNTIVKVLTALATVAGVVYIVATYGDKIVAWAKKLLASCPCKNDVEVEAEDAEAEAPAAEEAAPAEEPAAEETAVEEVVIEANEPVAEDADFEE